jgi:hypothetical protein
MESSTCCASPGFIPVPDESSFTNSALFMTCVLHKCRELSFNPQGFLKGVGKYFAMIVMIRMGKNKCYEKTITYSDISHI